MAIFWHVDNLKASHADPKAVDAFCGHLSGICRNNTMANCGKLHLCLAMDLDHKKKGGGD